jgi:hypothetical protein
VKPGAAAEIHPELQRVAKRGAAVNVRLNRVSLALIRFAMKLVRAAKRLEGSASRTGSSRAAMGDERSACASTHRARPPHRHPFCSGCTAAGT